MPVPLAGQRHIDRMKVVVFSIAKYEPSGLERRESSRTPRHFLEHDIIDQNAFNHLDFETRTMGSPYVGSA